MQRYRKFKFCFISMISLFSAFAMSESVDIGMVSKVVETHLEINSDFCHHSSAFAREDESRIYTIDKINPLESPDSKTILAHVIALKPKGYIVVSTDTDIRPVVAYSFSSDFSFLDCPDNALLHLLRQDMRLCSELIPDTDTQIIEENNRLWHYYLTGDERFICESALTTTWGPHIDTRWGQSMPYNMFCPLDPETGERCVSGCTPTSMAQIINFWEYPNSVSFTEGESYWSERTSPSIWIDAPSATMDTIIYNSGSYPHPENEMKGGIMWACGVSVHASYSSSATGAWFWEDVYRDKWSYIDARDVDEFGSEFYTDLRQNMFEGKPAHLAIYSTTGGGGGHSIICDGYRENGDFHLNYGWNGTSDGWYFLPEGMPAGYDVISFAILDITAPPRPDSPDECAAAIAITISDSLQGKLESINFPTDEDWFMFTTEPGYSYNIYTSGGMDTYAEIFDECGGSPIEVYDSSSFGQNFFAFFFPDCDGIYYLKVGNRDSSAMGNYSLFYRRAAGSAIELLNPNGGEIYDENWMAIVSWAKSGEPLINEVRLEYSITGRDGPWIEITASTSNPVHYMWFLPALDATSIDCWVKVTSIEFPNVSDMSDAPFTIRDSVSVHETDVLPQTLIVSISPNPFNDACRITLRNGRVRPTTIEIFDLQGNVVAGNGERFAKSDKQRPITDNRTQRTEFIWTPDESISSGIYLVRAITEDGSTETKRIVYLR